MSRWRRCGRKRGTSSRTPIWRVGSSLVRRIVLGKAFKDVVIVGENAGGKQSAFLDFGSAEDIVEVGPRELRGGPLPICVFKYLAVKAPVSVTKELPIRPR